MVAGFVQLTPMDSVSSCCAAARSATLMPMWKTSPHSRAGRTRPLRSVIAASGLLGGRGGRREELMAPVLPGRDLVHGLLAVHPQAAVAELDRVQLGRVDVERCHLVVGVLAEAVHQRDVVL